jgi:hypothetical protein
MVCNNLTTFFDPITTNANIVQRIGNGLNGYIRKIKIYDYPKTLPTFELMYKTTPQ